ncbi:sugar ABC transporter ATP-binding protein [Anaeropeptidivorans aminofermentans]|uniref:sugar ABC transporter ATP-binding protein n=1 Tax=Anaeropeptidivorans aminofermentans TaxID=2934315 RepID=UPI002025788A|nr:sugar ABC transporter ATP-binding protein [Anaeropeptidivorans aminofermentans]MBE6013267.1 sugar ABC transporter ATP-binding protein [Lachnospiraceae bacterium]
MEDENILLRVENVSKNFDGNVVLKSVNFFLAKGEILGLVGENGAGKSTLMNILFGMNFIHETGGYEGNIIFDGKKINFKNPVEALNAGIGMVHQEFSLIPGFSVMENILLNMEFTKSNWISKILGKNGKKLETLDQEKMHKDAQAAINTLGIHINPNILVEEMPVGHKQFIEIAREINRRNVKLIIMDEPTAVLTESEADILIKAMKTLAKMGISIIFISHRLREITDVCDKIVVLRDGAVVEERSTEGVTIKDMASWMVGRDVEREKEEGSQSGFERTIDDSEFIMEIKNLWVDMPGEIVKDVSLKVKRGEILGIGGLAGQGKLGIPNGIMGLYASGGEVLYNGKPLDITNTREVLQNNIAFVSEDRRGVGLLLDEGIDWNISFNAMQVQDKYLKKYKLFSIRDDKKMAELANQYIDELQIRCTGPQQRARNLSGGNQQKVCLAKAFAMHPKLLFVSEPTRGIDVGAKQLVLGALKRYNEANGTTIVMVSSELEELRSICDRIAIVYDGRIFGILSPDAQTHNFGLMMAGEEAGEGGND